MQSSYAVKMDIKTDDILSVGSARSENPHGKHTGNAEVEIKFLN
jgi:hypothetical protein